MGLGSLKPWKGILLSYGQPDLTADARRPHQTVGADLCFLLLLCLLLSYSLLLFACILHHGELLQRLKPVENCFWCVSSSAGVDTEAGLAEAVGGCGVRQQDGRRERKAGLWASDELCYIKILYSERCDMVVGAGAGGCGDKDHH